MSALVANLQKHAGCSDSVTEPVSLPLQCALQRDCTFIFVYGNQDSLVLFD